MSGQYEHEFGNREEIVYTGEGERDIPGKKRQFRDQVMRCGNLALKVCDLLSLFPYLHYRVYTLSMLNCYNINDQVFFFF